MKTSDVYLASALLSLNYKLISIDRTNPKHMIFSFGYFTDENNLGKVGETLSEHNLENVERAWANRSLVVNAFDFAEAIKRMKSLIHSS
jgi:hypothetical protein